MYSIPIPPGYGLWLYLYMKHSKQALVKRLKTIEGHLKKVTQMVEEDEYCIDVLQQTSAVKNAIKSAEVVMLDDHLHTCVIQDAKKGKKKAVDELLELFRKVNK